MKTHYKGSYFDGKNAARHDVSVEVTSGAIKITTENGSFVEWPFGSFTLTQGVYENDDLKFVKSSPSKDTIGEALIIRDKSFTEYLLQFLPKKYKSQFEIKNKFKKMVYFIPAGTLLAGLLLWLINFHGLPLLSIVVAEKISVKYEQSIGREAFYEYNKYSRFCGKGIKKDGKENELTKAMQSMVDVYSKKLVDNPYAFDVYIVKSNAVNAYALPGGHIVFYTGLIEKTESPEQMAGVLAHEMQHVIKKHSLRHIVRQNLVSFASTILFGGDLSGISNVAVMFSSLEYSRELETEADESGAKLMETSNIDINGMAEFFDILHKKKQSKDEKESDDADSEDGVNLLQYLSTHPLSKDRTEYIKEMADSANYSPKPIYPDMDWNKVKMSCSDKKSEKDK